MISHFVSVFTEMDMKMGLIALRSLHPPAAVEISSTAFSQTTLLLPPITTVHSMSVLTQRMGRIILVIVLAQHSPVCANFAKKTSPII